jgi:hypothetical protein
LLKLVLPAVDVEFLPLGYCGGVGEGAFSALPPKDPMVDDRPRRASRIGLLFGDDCAERTDLVESFRNKPEAGEARFIDAAASTTCDDEGISVPFSVPWSLVGE